MEPNKQWWMEERLKRTVEKLKSHGFEALYVATKEEVTKEILKYVGPNTKVGAGGSVTIRELGILDHLRAKGNIVYDHWVSGLSKEEILQIRKSQMNSDLYLSSVNAVTLNGELVNTDGGGNRVAATIFGPGKVILVAGYNKIVEDVLEAIERVKHVAAPINAKRLNLDLPCAESGKCIDCNSPNRICRATVIYERKPLLSNILVILVGEELGY